jgi:hypothetical protein
MGWKEDEIKERKGVGVDNTKRESSNNKRAD